MKTLVSFRWLLALAALSAALAHGADRSAPDAAAPLLPQKPTLGSENIVFVLAGDLWVVPRAGGEARRLTTGMGEETDPRFSPDGSQVAFTGEYDGNTDVFVVPAAGGVPKRLTFHPGPDRAVGWTRDGKQVVFSSPRLGPFYNSRLFLAPAEGGFPAALPLPMAEEGSYSADGSRLAYVPTMQWQRAWKRYRGGQTKRIWIARLEDSSVEMLPRENSNDFNPMWIDQTIYFLSDRNGPVTLFACDATSRRVKQVVENQGLDFKSAGAGPGGIVIEQFGGLLLFDLKSGKARPVPVTVTADFPEVRARHKKIEGKQLNGGRLSPTGQRALFEIRGEVLSLPAEKGDARNLTQTPAVAERDPSWSPDGRWIAYFSEEGGEYALHWRAQNGLGEVRKVALGDPPSFFYSPMWSPDSKQIAYTDKRGRLWLLELDKGTPAAVDTNTFGLQLDAPAWSPDSKWLAYARVLPNRLGGIFLYGLESKSIHPVTDGMSDAAFPAFDALGRYLFFAASTDSGPANHWGDLSSMNRPVTRNLYLAVLDKTKPSPLAPESDEEPIEDKKKDASDEPEKPDKSEKSSKSASKDTNAPPEVKIDFENLGQRILAIPMPPKNYKALAPGKTNFLFVLEGPAVERPTDEKPETTLHRFDFTKRKPETFVSGIGDFSLSHNREKLLYRKDEDWFVAGTDALPKGEEKKLNLEGIQVAVEPRVEWRQMYQEVWRIQRDWFYDPGYHGLNLAEASRRYAPYLDGLAGRADLNYLFEEMLGELSLGHVFIFGGDLPEAKKVKVGLLGADLAVENGRYRLARVFNGENWNPKLRAPLTEPGVGAAVGEYVLAVDGRDIQAGQSFYAYFQDKADKIVTLRLGPNADGTGARDVRVKPVDDEWPLRNRAWIEDNRRHVAELSQGRLGYVYLPDTFADGYENFNRYYFSQVDKDGFVIDERFNGGGWLADYFVDYLRRPIMNYSLTREGADISFPAGANAGPKVMIINEFAGSGGDALPWFFRKAKLGPLVGKRTWGGLVGIGGYPTLLDGGMVTAPHWAIYGTEGQWEVENVGIAPDYDVELDPKTWRAGRDAQLEKAVQLALDALRDHPPSKPKRPAFPNYHPAIRAPQ